MIDFSEFDSFIQIKLIKKQSNHKNVRTSEIIGFTPNLPTQGESFSMFGEGLEAGIRLVKTTPIIEVSNNIFKTENSTYEFEILHKEIAKDEVEKFLEHNLKNNLPCN